MQTTSPAARSRSSLAASNRDADPRSLQIQQVAALAAGQPTHFSDFAELFYHQQGPEGTGYVADGSVAGLASQIPIIMNSWHTARNDPSLVRQVVSEEQAAVTAGIKGTPTLVYQGPKGSTQVPEAVPSYAELQQILQTLA